MPLTRVQAGLIEATGTPDATTFLRGDGSWATPATGGITSGTAVSASGTSVDFTGIPSTVKRITVMVTALSTNGTSQPLIQIGSGSIENTGYVSTAVYSGSATGAATSTAGFLIGAGSGGAADTRNGTVVITLLGSNIWTFSGALTLFEVANYMVTVGGAKTTSGALDRVRITTVNGTDTFDAGTINILYES